MRSEGLSDRPVYFVSSNTHALANLVTGMARAHEKEISEYVAGSGQAELVAELRSFQDGSAEGNWDNFLYFAARAYAAQSADDQVPGVGWNAPQGFSISTVAPRSTSVPRSLPSIA